MSPGRRAADDVGTWRHPRHLLITRDDRMRHRTPPARRHSLAHHRPLVAFAAAGALLVGLTACGSDDTTSASTAASTAATTAASTVPPTTAAATTTAASTTATPTTATATTAAPTTAASTTASPANSTPAGDAKAPIANAVTVTAPGMSYSVSGTLRPGVAAITFVNSDSVAHMLGVSRLKPGVTLDQVKAAAGQSEDAAGALLADGPDTTYGTPAPLGAGESTTVTALDLPAGDYVLICFFADASGTPHYQMGMIGMLSVTGDPATEKPDSDGTITIDDTGTKLPDGFSGRGTYLVTNSGTTPHSISLARLDDGTTLEAYYQHVGQAMNGGGTIDGGGGTLAGGVDELAPGASAYLTIDLAAGHYGYVSTADASGPQLPAQSGEFTVS